MTVMNILKLVPIWVLRKEAGSIWCHISSGKVQWRAQLEIVLAVERSPQIGPITVRSSRDCLTDRPFPPGPTQFGDGNQRLAGNHWSDESVPD